MNWKTAPGKMIVVDPWNLGVIWWMFFRRKVVQMVVVDPWNLGVIWWVLFRRKVVPWIVTS